MPGTRRRPSPGRDLDGALADLKTAFELEVTPEQSAETRDLQAKIQSQREEGG